MVLAQVLPGSSESVTLLAAFAGGLVSFLSPCVLPIVPGYLSIITGLEVSEIQAEGRANGWRIVTTTSLFILGFGSVFVLLGLSATAVGSFFTDHLGAFTRVSGFVMLSMGLFLLGSLILQAPWLYQERRFQPDLDRFGPFATPLAGAAFGFGWTPCIGPVLTSVLAIAAADGRAGRGALLLAVYSLGLGLPFMVVGLAFGRLAGAMSWVKNHFHGLTVLSAAVLVLFGIVLTLNRLNWVTEQVSAGLEAVGLGRLVEVG